MTPVTSSSSTHIAPPTLLETAKTNIENFRDLLDIATTHFEEGDSILKELQILDQYLADALDPKKEQSIFKQKDLQKAYTEIQEVVKKFADAHGNECGIEPLQALK